MRICWGGHATFVIQVAGMTLITDPVDESYGYAQIKDIPDVVTVSHEHKDHSAVHRVQGSPAIVRGIGKWEFPGLLIESFSSYHDKTGGSERGENTIFKITAEEIKLLHAGDLGERLLAQKISDIGPIDILLLPVGGVYTIEGSEAAELVRMIKPKITIPMHYQTPALIMSKELAAVETFTRFFDHVIYKKELDITQEELAVIEEPQIYVLDYE